MKFEDWTDEQLQTRSRLLLPTIGLGVFRFKDELDGILDEIDRRRNTCGCCERWAEVKNVATESRWGSCPEYPGHLLAASNANHPATCFKQPR